MVIHEHRATIISENEHIVIPYIIMIYLRIIFVRRDVTQSLYVMYPTLRGRHTHIILLYRVVSASRTYLQQSE